MAGTDPRFNATTFRDGIRFAMNMGLPEDTTERATFRWLVQKDYAQDDPNRNPYDWTSTPTSEIVREDVQVAVAVEFSRGTAPEGTPVGQFERSRVVVTILDEEFAQINLVDDDDNPDLPQQMLFDGDVYLIDFVAPPLGLFDVTVYQLYCRVKDEH